MKNIVALWRPKDIEDFAGSQLRTDRFKDSLADKGGYIRHWVSRFGQIPRIFFDMNDGKVEHPHFYPWMGCFMRRDYDNPAVNDLFWLHEIGHAVMLDYDERTTFDGWLQKMIENELRTALESECMVYWEIPGLRSDTFAFEIWADRFLEKPMRSREVMFAERRRAMNAPTDGIEQEMSCYPRQNKEWGDVWKTRWNEVEKAMRLLTERASEQEGASAIENHRQWLVTGTGMTTEKPYPFPEEAEGFAQIYWTNKEAGRTRYTGHKSAAANPVKAAKQTQGRQP